MEFELWAIIFSIIFAVAAVLAAIVAIMSSMCKGPLISQAWTMSTPEQREKLDKKAEYQSVAAVMGGLSVAFVLLGAYILFMREWMFWSAIVVAAAAVWAGMMGGLNRLRKRK